MGVKYDLSRISSMKVYYDGGCALHLSHVGKQ